VNAALGPMFAFVLESMVMDVYSSVKAITDPGVHSYVKSLVNGPDIEAAYVAWLEFMDVVNANQVATEAASFASTPGTATIGEATKKHSAESYPFLNDVDWLSSIYLKLLPGAAVGKTPKAVDKATVMGSAMDRDLPKAAAEAHHKASCSIDANGVTSAADYEAVNAALGRAVASVPKSIVMDVYDAFAGIVDSSIPNNICSSVDPLNAHAATIFVYDLKVVVQASLQ